MDTTYTESAASSGIASTVTEVAHQHTWVRRLQFQPHRLTPTAHSQVWHYVRSARECACGAVETGEWKRRALAAGEWQA
jgi:hypothetical protein